jgi:hypothetical protein
MGVLMSAVAALYRRARRRIAEYEPDRALREGEERSRGGDDETLRRYELLVANSRDIILFMRHGP